MDQILQVQYEEEGPLELLLNRRSLTHGDFADNAAICQAIKDILHTAPGWKRMCPVMREAAEQICLKLSRAVSGNPLHKDTWLDIAGYAQLVANSIPRDCE